MSVAADGRATAQQPEQADEAEVVRALAVDNANLEALVELAKEPEFYLVLDPQAGTLRLMLRGAELRTFAIEGVQVGLPRIAFIRRHAPGAWRGRIWTGGELDPPREIERVHLAVPPPGAEEEPEVVIPPTPEEAYPAPLRYHLAFPGGPALEIRPLDTAEDAGLWSRFSSWWVSYWGDLWAAFTTEPDERLRLRLQLSPDEAGALYRSVPPNVSLLVV
jgi:hypothetical protein